MFFFFDEAVIAPRFLSFICRSLGEKVFDPLL